MHRPLDEGSRALQRVDAASSRASEVRGVGSGRGALRRYASEDGAEDDQRGDHEGTDQRFPKRAGARQVVRHADLRVGGRLSGATSASGWRS